MYSQVIKAVPASAPSAKKRSAQKTDLAERQNREAPVDGPGDGFTTGGVYGAV